MTGEAIDKVVLAPMCLISDHHYVAAFRQHWVCITLGLREEFLDGREDHAAGGNLEQFAQVCSARCLDRRLAQEILAAGEGAEELVVEVVAVREHHQGRVLHARLHDHATGVECHCQALSRTLRMPDYPHPLVTVSACG